MIGTQVLSINTQSLEKAKQLILNGDVVAFPTETVYGLGANALNDESVKKIFEIKGRPSDNPLIVHVHNEYDISTLVSVIPEYAKLLAKAFLPGPLTMVYQSKGKVSPYVSCGLDTLAIRIPSHKGAQEFLRAVNLPIAAPSANISKHVSPVTAEHVQKDLYGKIEIVLQGGKCKGGIESTVLDCTGDVPCILRSGLVTKEMIEAVVGICDVYVPQTGEKVKSPGMKYKHYSPNCQTALYSYENRLAAIEYYKSQVAKGVKALIMTEDAVLKEFSIESPLNLGKTEWEMASNLYEKLREGEEIAELIIAIAPQKQDGVMVGVMNRLSKACYS